MPYLDKDGNCCSGHEIIFTKKEFDKLVKKSNEDYEAMYKEGNDGDILPLM